MQKKKTLALLLCVLLLAALVPTALAAGGSRTVQPAVTVETVTEAAAVNSCGENTLWSISSGGVLSVSGVGAMFDYTYGTAPWYGERWGISSVTVGEGVTAIGAYAFAGCSQIRDITLSATVTAIGDGAFDDCRNLNYVTVAAGNPAYQAQDGVLLSRDGAALLLVPEGLFGAYTVPDTVRSVEYSAFANCRYLTGVTLPTSLVSISGNAFTGCTGLTEISLAEGNTAYQTVDGALLTADGTGLIYCPGGKTGSYTVPETVRDIQYSALADCSRLSEVTIPTSVVTIGEKAFAGCESLQDVHYGGTQAEWRNVFIDEGNEPLTHATLHFDALLPGDLNSDNVLTAEDLALLAKYVRLKGVGVTLDASGDLNGDGSVNGADLVRLAKLLG